VSVGVGYNGLLEGPQFYRSFGAVFFNLGSNMIASVNYSFAPRNDVAQGQLAQAEASIRQTVLTRADVARNIASSVVTAMTTLVNSIAGLRKAREAVAYYRLALNDQQEKFRLGLGSLVDVLTMEDRLTSALTGELSAQLSYATALENLRFATGTVINPVARVHTLNRDTFLRAPFEWGGK
jgi:outer membrane protein TolC